MSQKTNPYVFRLGHNQFWNNRFVPRNKREQIVILKRCKAIRDCIQKFLPNVAHNTIDHSDNVVNITVYTSNAAIVLGENNKNLEQIMKELNKAVDNKSVVVKIDLVEVGKVYTNAHVIARLVADQLESRVRSREVFKEVISRSIFESEVKGVQIKLKGLIDGMDIHQTKQKGNGKMPLSTIDNHIEFSKSVAITSRGTIGIKVWLNLGKKFLGKGGN